MAPRKFVAITPTETTRGVFPPKQKPWNLLSKQPASAKQTNGAFLCPYNFYSWPRCLAMNPQIKAPFCSKCEGMAGGGGACGPSSIRKTTTGGSGPTVCPTLPDLGRGGRLKRKNTTSCPSLLWGGFCLPFAFFLPIRKKIKSAASPTARFRILGAAIRRSCEHLAPVPAATRLLVPQGIKGDHLVGPHKFECQNRENPKVVSGRFALVASEKANIREKKWG